jgi:hypothetical protein
MLATTSNVETSKKKKSSPEAKKKIVRQRNQSDSEVQRQNSAVESGSGGLWAGGAPSGVGESSSPQSLFNLPHWRHQTSPMSGPSPAMTELANLVRFSFLSA